MKIVIVLMLLALAWPAFGQGAPDCKRDPRQAGCEKK